MRTDHSSLTWLLGFKEPQGQLARWIEELSQYNMVLQHRAGRKHINADALSRIPYPELQCDSYIPGVKPTELPCGGCSYCKRADSHWGTFTREVDDAVPLTSQGLSAVTRGVVHDARSPGSGSDDRAEPQIPLAGDTVQDLKQNPGIGVSGFSAEETFGVGANNQDRYLEGNTVNCISGTNGASLQTDMAQLQQHKVAELPNAPMGLRSPWDPGSSDDSTYIEIQAEEDGYRVKVCNVEVQRPDFNLACWGFGIAEVQTAQKKDQSLTILLEWLVNNTVPSERDLFLSSPAVKAYWLEKEQFLLIGGILYHQRPEREEKDLVVPESLREEAIRVSHDLPSSGHQGIVRTKARMKEKFYWYGIGKDVTNYIVTCPVCSRNKKSGAYGRVPLQEYQSGAPMERVHIEWSKHGQCVTSP